MWIRCIGIAAWQDTMYWWLLSVQRHLLLVHYRNVFCCSGCTVFGRCVFHWLSVHADMQRPHNSGFLVPPLCLVPQQFQCVSARLYRQWSGISELECMYNVAVKSHHKTNIKLQYRFCVNSLLLNYGKNGSNKC